jgi:two-component system chemotaxis sensor kinase CheA
LAGATILGDGRVAMILDVHGLTQIHVPFGSGNFLPASMTDSYLPLGELT